MTLDPNDPIRTMLLSEMRAILDSWEPREWFTVPEAATYARMSKSTMHAHVRSGKVPSHRFEGSVRISRRELDETLAAAPSARAVA